MAPVYQQNYIELRNNKNNAGLCNPNEFNKNANGYLGWREVCVQFSQLFATIIKTQLRIIKSCRNPLTKKNAGVEVGKFAYLMRKIVIQAYISTDKTLK